MYVYITISKANSCQRLVTAKGFVVFDDDYDDDVASYVVVVASVVIAFIFNCRRRLYVKPQKS